MFLLTIFENTYFDGISVILVVGISFEADRIRFSHASNDSSSTGTIFVTKSNTDYFCYHNH